MTISEAAKRKACELANAECGAGSTTYTGFEGIQYPPLDALARFIDEVNEKVARMSKAGKAFVDECGAYYQQQSNYKTMPETWNEMCEATDALDSLILEESDPLEGLIGDYSAQFVRKELKRRGYQITRIEQ